MGTTLTGTTPANTYDSLIKVTDNGPLSGSLKVLTDGLGNNSTLSLSTAAANVDGLLTLAAFTTDDLSASPQLSLTRGATQFTGIAIRGSVAADRALFSVGSDDALYIGRHAGGGGAWTKQVSFLDNGNVGIGTDAPASLLHISQAAANTTLRIGNNANYDQFIYFNGGNDWSFGMDYSDSNAFVLSNASTVGTNNRLVFTTAGVIEISQGQLQFPATQIASANANTLDDYEEGTWTMGIAFGGAAVGVTASSNTGTYTKIGRQVTVNGYLALTSKGSSTGDATITGLPFTIANTTGNNSAASLRLDSITFTNQFQGFGGDNSTTINLGEITVLGVVSSLTDADFANNSTVIVSLTYFV